MPSNAGLGVETEPRLVAGSYQHAVDLSSVTYPEAIRCNDPSPVIVVYHHLSEDRDDLVDHLGVTTRPEVFRAHVSYYKRNFDIIGQSDLLAGKLPERPLLITFDDIYRSVSDVAAPILREVNAPSLQFLNPSSVLKRTIPFDNLISLAVEKLGAAWMTSLLDEGSNRVLRARQIIARLTCQLDLVRAREVRSAILRALGMSELDIWASTRLFMTAQDVSILAGHGIDVGNHSMNHPFFRSLSPNELAAEIEGGKLALEQMTGRPIRALSIPYGNEDDATPAALAVARSSGHEVTFLVHGRCNRRRPAPDVYYRTSPRDVPAWLLPLMVGGLPRLRGFVGGRLAAIAAKHRRGSPC